MHSSKIYKLKLALKLITATHAISECIPYRIVPLHDVAGLSVEDCNV